LSKASADTLEKVSGEFEGEALADLQGGREQALALIDAAKRETKEEVSKVLEAGAKQAEALKRQIVGSAELEARNARLRVLEKAVNEAISDSLSGLPKLEKKRYEMALSRLISEGVEVIGREAKVLCSTKDKATVSSVLKETSKRHPGLSEGGASLETSGGVALTSADGSVRFDNTFEARLERLRPTLRKEVADLLSG
jgi:V/A-type H+/Na+-transporting ATPase subunit E